MTLDEFNGCAPDAAAEDLMKCCGARRWAAEMNARRPFASREALLAASDEIWAGMKREDLLEAFTHHPKIGDIESLRKKFASTAAWASGEQSGVSGAGDEVLRGLSRGNEEYERKFGYIFIVCATGRSAEEMLDLLRERLKNDPARELALAAGEQRKITRIRLEKLLG